MNQTKAIFAFVLLILFIFFLIVIAHDEAANPGNVKSDKAAPVSTESVVDYENGVYYFHSCKVAFGNTLSAFIKKHPDLDLVAMAPNDTSGYGATSGYFVVFRPKK
jgi:hypothetical protein